MGIITVTTKSGNEVACTNFVAELEDGEIVNAIEEGTWAIMLNGEIMTLAWSQSDALKIMDSYVSRN